MERAFKKFIFKFSIFSLTHLLTHSPQMDFQMSQFESIPDHYMIHFVMHILLEKHKDAIDPQNIPSTPGSDSLQYIDSMKNQSRKTKKRRDTAKQKTKKTKAK